MESEADCFSNSPESFAKWDQDTFSWKTFQRSLIEEWATLSEPWPRSGMTASGTAYPLRPLVRLIDATECSFWPTPAASNAKGAAKNRFRTSPTYRGNLDEAVRDSPSSGQLNPNWVEWLMGFPLGWTVCDASETPSSRKSPRS